MTQNDFNPGEQKIAKMHIKTAYIMGMITKERETFLLKDVVTAAVVECAYCHTPFKPKIKGDITCDDACGASYKKEQERIAFKHDTYNLL